MFEAFEAVETFMCAVSCNDLQLFVVMCSLCGPAHTSLQNTLSSAVAQKPADWSKALSRPASWGVCCRVDMKEKYRKGNSFERI